MKKTIAALGMAATTIAGAGIAAQGANATPTATHTYAHGTARMASFTSWSTCQVHATSTAKSVSAHGGKLVAGDTARAKCFPVNGGRWSYLTLYTATSPLMKGDLTGNALNSTRGDWVWSYEHHESGEATVFTQAKCEAAMKRFTSRVIAGTNIRLLPHRSCESGGHVQRHLSASYLGTSGTVGLKGDHADGLWQQDSITSEAYMLGYAV